MNELVLLLGSNLDDREQILLEASRQIENKIGQVTSRSKLYQTAAWGNEDQPIFLNQVLVVNTTKSVRESLTITQEIELGMGRVRYERWGPRLIDIDILYYNALVLEEGDLVVPHPQMHKRRFTLVPLVEVLPEKLHPIFNCTSKMLLDNCEDRLDVDDYQFV